MADSCHTPCKGRKASCTRPRCAASWLVPADAMMHHAVGASHGRPLVLVKQSSFARAFRVAFLATASSFHQRQGDDCTIQQPCRRDQTAQQSCSFGAATDRTYSSTHRSTPGSPRAGARAHAAARVLKPCSPGSSRLDLSRSVWIFLLSLNLSGTV